jgi:hypothetical protein
MAPFSIEVIAKDDCGGGGSEPGGGGTDPDGGAEPVVDNTQLDAALQYLFIKMLQERDKKTKDKVKSSKTVDENHN